MKLFIGSLTSEDPIEWAVDPDGSALLLNPTSAQLDALLSALRVSGLTALPVQ